MKIYEGEELIAKKNRLLKEFLFIVPEKLKGKEIIKGSFKIDNNFILYVKLKIDNKTQINKIQLDKDMDELEFNNTL